MKYLKEKEKKLMLLSLEREPLIAKIRHSLKRNLQEWNCDGERIINSILWEMSDYNKLGLEAFGFSPRNSLFSVINIDDEILDINFYQGLNYPEITIKSRKNSKTYECCYQQASSFDNCISTYQKNMLSVNLVESSLTFGYTTVTRNFRNNNATINVSDGDFKLDIIIENYKTLEEDEKFVLPNEEDFIKQLLTINSDSLPSLRGLLLLISDFFGNLIPLDNFSISLKKKNSLIYDFQMTDGIISKYSMIKNTSSGLKILIKLRKDGIIGFQNLDKGVIPTEEATEIVVEEILNIKKMTKIMPNTED